eukprot:2361475-Alexandrium_andersonii.AAC.1
MHRRLVPPPMGPHPGLLKGGRGRWRSIRRLAWLRPRGDLLHLCGQPPTRLPRLQGARARHLHPSIHHTAPSPRMRHTRTALQD